MGRKNRRKAVKKKEYTKNLPDIVLNNSKSKPPKKEPKISPPPLAMPDADTYGVEMPQVLNTPAKEKAFAAEAPARASAPTGKTTLVFVDYEHWFYSMWSEFGIRPNIDEWFGYIAHEKLVDVRFYADFSKEEIFKELPRIRRFTNTVIDTRSPNAKVEKDFTDFCILNDLYRIAWQNTSIEKVVILSGDGHFSPAVTFLRTVCGVEVEIYGVKACIHTSLRLSATVLHELPGSLDYLLPCSKDILVYVDKVKKKASWYQFCFMALAEQVSECYGYSMQIVKDAIETLTRQGYLYRDVRYVNGQEKNILEADWDAIAKGGLSPPNARYASTLLSASAGNTPAAKIVTIYAAEDAEDADEGIDEEDATDSFIKAQMDDIDRQSDNNASNFMQLYRQQAAL